MMAYTRAQKAKDVAVGAGTGAAINTALVGGLAVAKYTVPVVAKVAGVVLTAPVALTAMAALAVAGAGRAYAQSGGNVTKTAVGAVAGSLGVFPKFENTEARVILASDKRDAAVEKNLATANRNLDRAGRALNKAGADTGSPRATAVPESHTPTAAEMETERIAKLPFGQRMVAKAEHVVEGLIFGNEKLKDAQPDKYEKARQTLTNDLKRQQDLAAKEVAQNGAQKGPNQRAYDAAIDKIRGELKANDKAEQRDNEASSQLYRSIGGAVAGIGAGVVVGNAIKTIAKTAAVGAEASIAKVAQDAGRLASASKRGVIAGTIEGDKAKAAVAVAAKTAAKPLISAGEAYAVPVLTGAQGVGAVALAEHLDNEASKKGEGHDPMAAILRTEGMASLTLGVFSGKAALAARAMRPNVSAANLTRLGGAENRIAREARGGPSGVAQAKGQAKVAQARSKAVVAKGGANVDAIKAGAKVQAAGVRAGRDTAIAKVQGAASVERAEIAAKAGNSRAIQRENVNPKYKDVWQDKRGRVYHRKDLSVRTGKSANDNGRSAMRKGA